MSIYAILITQLQSLFRCSFLNKWYQNQDGMQQGYKVLRVLFATRIGIGCMYLECAHKVP